MQAGVLDNVLKKVLYFCTLISDNGLHNTKPSNILNLQTLSLIYMHRIEAPWAQTGI